MSRREALKGILRYAKRHMFWVAVTMVCAVLTVAAQLLVPYFVGKAIDEIVGKGDVHFSALNKYLLFIGVCLAVGAAAQYLVSLSNDRIAYRMLADMREDGFRKIGALPLKYIDARPYGEVMSVLLSDSEQLSEGLLLGFTQLFTGAATIMGVLVVMLVMKWQIALIVLLVTPLSLFAAKIIASRTYRMFKAQVETQAEETAFVEEMVGNLKTVKAYTHEDENEEAFAKIDGELKGKSLKAVFFSSTTNPVTRFVNAVVYALVAGVGALFVIAEAGMVGAFSVGSLTTFLSYSTQYTKPFNEISEVLAEFQNALACAGRLLALINEEEEPSDEGAEELSSVQGEVAMEDVCFSYEEDRPLIEHFSLTAHAGERIAIVGPTGCGKTTLINLLMRFYDVKGGRVTVDGRDIRTVTRGSLRKSYGMVLQETWIQRGTVRENLCMGAPNCAEEDMLSAARATHVHAFVEKLPEGYDTVIGGEGALSEGQKQLLCIARAMISLPTMLILDEATSSIDTRTERLVQDAFVRLMEGRTCFIVAHRLSTIETADRILVMRDGHIVEQGKHEELLRKGGFYAALYAAQFQGAETASEENK